MTKNKKKMENTQINNEDDKKIPESNQHNNENNTLGTIYVPKMLEAGTYTITKAPAEKERAATLLEIMIDKTAAVAVVATIRFIFYVLFRLMYYFITSLF